ncbi:hypothetical protein CH254_02445 [Rhodococcus sp. 06-412-2C]|uniref:hypothetical protein n=1 Tax=unclassified Rhodococcus (in: high G+C Gram-positive bacteria) TaxID=192944 RepID=UPI000B9AFCFB|nr:MULTISPECIES: hypothetical protein [unclassified Rhodococcus (in: high G+C Gram-positive bacteria)]OZC90343.1 hypothetical protein CH279_28555 [Rhodococcus sp. 06-412-2B]OZC90374.1 hypothetical protein CH279_28755 [Rhodococcus sp. 06-412-2B]OZC93075.1 hypothetical protein CH254_02445 [Rhodococcus sp. 06-412-2C]
MGHFEIGETVVAVRNLGRVRWRSGIPKGTVGIVVGVDWLGDARVNFTVDGSMRARGETVEHIVADGDVRTLRAAPRRMFG